MKVLVSIPEGNVRDGFLDKGSLKLLEDNFEVSYNDLGRNYTKDELSLAAMDTDILITGWGTPTLIGGLGGNSRLRMIAHTAGSVGDLLDNEAYEKGIKVVSGNRLFAESVAEGTIAYMMSALRKIPDEIDGLRDGFWRHPDVTETRGLLDRQIGIIGYGMISRCLMQMLSAFRCSFRIFSHHPMDEKFLASVNATPASSIDEIFTTCDIVSLHSSLGGSTKSMLGKEHFEMLPKNAVFINTARGKIIKESELTEVLKKRPDIFAVLDVFEKEPLDIESELRRLKNVYPLPHRAGPTNDRFPYIGRAVVEDVIRFKNGEELLHEISAGYATRMTRHI